MSAVISSNSGYPQSLTWKRGLCIVTFVSFGLLLQGANETHLISFFDLYGLREKGLSSTQYGIIIGSYSLLMVVGSPLTAKLVTLRYFDDRTLMLIAWTIDATFGLILSFAYKLERGNPFFFGCLILRILEASGCAIGFIMAFVMVGSELEEYSHITIPVLETVYGASVVAGPALSGVLYDLGGFAMPFRVLGGILMFWMVLAMAVFPKPKIENQQDDAMEDSSVWSKLGIPVFVNVFCTISAFISITSNEATLALQLNAKFGMNATDAGLTFLYAGGFYTISCLLLGFLSKRVPDPRSFILFGQLISLVASALQGPLVPIQQTKNVFFFAQILLGFGAGPAHVCGYLHSLKYLSKGKETKELHAALSAVFISASLTGGAIGPLLAGIIRQHYSYESVVVANALQIGLTSIVLLITMCAVNKTSKDAGRT